MNQCTQCALTLRCEACQPRAPFTMGREQMSGGVITYPSTQPPPLPRRINPARDYQNVNPVRNESRTVGPKPLSKVNMINATSLDTNCFLMQQQRHLAQRHDLDEQLHQLQMQVLQKTIEQKRQQLKELELQTQQLNSIPRRRDQTSPAALLITATQSPFDWSPSLEVSRLHLLSPAPPTPVRGDLEVLEKSRREAEQCSWYHGIMSHEASEQLLLLHPAGTYLLRCSSSPDCLYTLSVNQSEIGPTSIRILFNRGSFLLDAISPVRHAMPRFVSVLELIEYYALLRNCTEKSNRLLQLTRPLHKRVSSLSHLARLSINRSMRAQGTRELAGLELPTKVREFLLAYPSTL